MKCSIHDCDMEWIAPLVGDYDGFWHCEECWKVEESQYERAEEVDEFDDDWEPVSTCVYCGSQCHDGYCWASPNGNHAHEGD